MALIFTLILVVAILSLLLVWHLFFRFSFSPPTEFPNLKQHQIENTHFLVENGLPYSSGIRASSRAKILLNGTWRFQLDDENEATEVSVPPCFNTADSLLR